ncbi:MAG: ATP-grasp domain-containing protein [Rhodospirillales bacterium]|jgi:biotin carboxylase|nr:ATP-grasp domain-containing protein [Rhodospirillales bacterium]MDP6645164.1 ATP-grasp domain-containing protein [Rhodospirillales bacterium]|tara:strand:- start:360 stop:1604 length:1245 start_codon:yes stop_codon:yes gene_type:complete
MRLLLLIPTHSYRVNDFMDAARAQGVEVIVGSEKRQSLEGFSKGGTFVVDFRDFETGLRQIIEHTDEHPVQAVIGVDETTVHLAALASQALGLKGNAPDAVSKAVDKSEFRRALAKTGLPVPDFKLISADTAAKAAAANLPYPCVLKPLGLSASRGVIRADDADQAENAIARIRAILDTPGADGEVARAKDILAEAFIAGAEFALEGILRDGQLTVLALFDKPDPLDGPYFEETIYVTPSRLSEAQQSDILRAVESAAAAIGLREGPVHAELRLNLDAGRGVNEGPWLIELAPRSIGGHCARALQFGTGQSLEEIVIRHALGRDFNAAGSGEAAGVMMIPIEKKGTLRLVGGLEAARALPHISEVTISIATGGEVIPLPEGFRYLGFIFARAPTPAAVEQALRNAHAALDIVID